MHRLLSASAAADFLNAGLPREKVALVVKASCIAKLSKRLESDSRLVKISACACQALDTENAAYHGMSHLDLLLGGWTPIEAMLAGNDDQVVRLIINIEHGLPI
ncbi:MAG: hypothetical protein IPP88_02535 [Betaproteobacteria bacterium]|nr:hypothetical protein [Betaproteobacteria bacterium]